MVCFGPVPDQVQGRRLGCRIIEQPHPEGGQGADDLPGAAVRPSHLYELLQPDLGEDGGQVVLPVLQRRPLTCAHSTRFLSSPTVQLDAMSCCSAYNWLVTLDLLN